MKRILNDHFIDDTLTLQYNGLSTDFGMEARGYDSSKSYIDDMINYMLSEGIGVTDNTTNVNPFVKFILIHFFGLNT